MRKAIVSGQFYEKDKNNLIKQIQDCFNHELGKKLLKKKKYPASNKFIGLISPHAGYIYSGPCASNGFAYISKTFLPNTIILLGPNHTGQAQASFSLSMEDFETPLGIVKNDKELALTLLKSSKILRHDELAHQYEHSLEVQLPFLQYIYKLAGKEKDLKIIPIVISTQDYDLCIQLAQEISRLLIQNKDKQSIGIIASSDLTHYGHNYGFMPFPSRDAKKGLYGLDGKAISEILNLNPEAFFQRAIRTTICGFAAIVVLTEISRLLKDKNILKNKPKLLKYYTSGDIINDYSNSVGYASIAFA